MPMLGNLEKQCLRSTLSMISSMSKLVCMCVCVCVSHRVIQPFVIWHPPWTNSRSSPSLLGRFGQMPLPSRTSLQVGYLSRHIEDLWTELSHVDVKQFVLSFNLLCLQLIILFANVKKTFQTGLMQAVNCHHPCVCLLSRVYQKKFLATKEWTACLVYLLYSSQNAVRRVCLHCVSVNVFSLSFYVYSLSYFHFLLFYMDIP